MRRIRTVFGFLALTVLAIGCQQGSEGPVDKIEKVQQKPDGAKYLLADKPEAAQGVIEVKKLAKDGEEVLVTGRIAGSKTPIVKDRAAFTIVDLSLEQCSDSDEPWVCCCVPKEELIPAMVMIKVVDEKGSTLNQDARRLLSVKENATVTVRGKAKRDPDGGVSAILLTGIHVHPASAKE